MTDRKMIELLENVTKNWYSDDVNSVLKALKERQIDRVMLANIVDGLNHFEKLCKLFQDVPGVFDAFRVIINGIERMLMMPETVLNEMCDIKVRINDIRERIMQL